MSEYDSGLQQGLIGTEPGLSGTGVAVEGGWTGLAYKGRVKDSLRSVRKIKRVVS